MPEYSDICFSLYSYSPYGR